jgi:hypothetical protein
LPSSQQGGIAARPLPNVKSSPVTTPAAPMRFASNLGDEILGAGRRQLGVEAEDQHRVGAGIGEQPLALVEVVSRNGGTSGLKKRTGCGSKVATITGRRS